MALTARPYQVRLINDVRRAIMSGKKRILVVLPTGAGKGWISATMLKMAAEKGNESVFFAGQRELIHQLGNHLYRMGLPAQVIMAGVKNEYESGEEFAASSLVKLVAKDTLWSRAFKRGTMEVPPARIVHYDEAHGSLAQTTQAILEHYADSIVIGWTATPCRSDNKPLGKFYDCMVTGPTYKELQAEGFLVPVRVIAPDRPDLKGIASRAGDYAKAALEKRMNRDEMVGNIINEWLRHSNNRSTIVFASGVAHSRHICDEFLRVGITAEHLDGSMETAEREAILARVASGETKVLCNYGVGTTGLDIPRLKYLVCARPTKSFALWRQLCGRVQRPYKKHDHCMIQDHSDNTLVFGFPDEDVEWDIHGDHNIAEKHKEQMRQKKDPKEATDPFACPQCKTVYRGPLCPSCGHRPERKKEKIQMSREELKELSRARANREATKAEKQMYWEQALGQAIGQNKKVGVAAHMYRERYGVFPSSKVIDGLPKSVQWRMNARDFYREVVKPNRQAEDMAMRAEAKQIVKEHKKRGRQR